LEKEDVEEVEENQIKENRDAPAKNHSAEDVEEAEKNLKNQAKEENRDALARNHSEENVRAKEKVNHANVENRANTKHRSFSA
jgi:hypothetical protein